MERASRWTRLQAMVSTSFQPSVGSSGRERVRWIERNYATQNIHKAARAGEKEPGNGGLMECGVDGCALDGSRAVELRRRAESGRDRRRQSGTRRSTLDAADRRAMGLGAVAGCRGVVQRWKRGLQRGRAREVWARVQRGRTRRRVQRG